MTQDIACPICGTELTLAQLFANEDTQRAFSQLASLSIPLGARVLQYVTLFAPAKTRLTVPKQIKLILQLLPDMERRAITHRGRDWSAPLNCWSQAIDQMLVARDMNKLDLPMKGHAYLYSILMGLADKVEAGAEAQSEAQRRTPAATFQVRGQSMPMGQALEQVFGGRDPVLAKMDAHAKVVASVPQASRDHLASLRNRASQTQIKKTP